MPLDTLSEMPSEFTAGDTLIVGFSDSDFPAGDGWVLTLALKGPGQFNVIGVADGDAFTATLSSALTDDELPGVYDWTAVVALAGERATIGAGKVRMKPNLLSTAETWAKQCLDLLEAHISGRLPRGLENHTINGNSISKIPIDEAVKLRAYFKAEVAREEAAASGSARTGRILQRFA